MNIKKLEKIKTIVSGILLVLIGFLALVLVAVVRHQQSEILKLKARIVASQKVCKEKNIVQK
jgi:hypothetical protein